MKALKQIFDFYINSSIHVAFAVVAFTVLTYLEFDIEPNVTLLYFIALATISGYNFVKYFGLAKFHHRSLATWLKVIQVFSILCTAVLPFFIFKMEFKTVLFLFCLGVITFLYAVPFIPRKYLFDSNQNLRQISGLKIYIIAFVWTAVTIGLPLLASDYPFSFDVGVALVQRFVLVLVLVLPFEIRDLKYDSLRLSTIPQTIGIKNTKTAGIVLICFYIILEFFKDELSLEWIMSSIIMIVLSFILLLKSRKEQGQYYSAFLVEGVPIVWLLMTLLSQFLFKGIF